VARVVEIAMSLALVGVTVMVVLQVFFRYVLESPLSFTEEIARFLTIWTALLGASLGVRSGSHFAVIYLTGRLPSRVRTAVLGIVQVGAAAFVVLLLVTGLQYMQSTAIQVSPASRVPLGLVYGAVPVSALLMLLFLFTEAAGGPPRPLGSELGAEEMG
jgi:TRAP-type C4-dicarboxylate transport system permease small subunit